MFRVATNIRQCWLSVATSLPGLKSLRSSQKWILSVQSDLPLRSSLSETVLLFGIPDAKRRTDECSRQLTSPLARVPDGGRRAGFIHAFCLHICDLVKRSSFAGPTHYRQSRFASGTHGSDGGYDARRDNHDAVGQAVRWSFQSGNNLYLLSAGQGEVVGRGVLRRCTVLWRDKWRRDRSGLLHNAPQNEAVRYAVTAPGVFGNLGAFVAELMISFTLMSTILFVSNHQSLAQFTPYFVGALYATYITFETPLSGMSMNPARTFGPALYAADWHALWIYFIAPTFGMLAGAELFIRTRGGDAPIVRNCSTPMTNAVSSITKYETATIRIDSVPTEP